jgi:hypothetical protein
MNKCSEGNCLEFCNHVKKRKAISGAEFMNDFGGMRGTFLKAQYFANFCK